MFYVDQIVYRLVCLVCYETMAVKNFDFGKNWVGSEVASMKIAIFAIFGPIWTHIMAPTSPNLGFLKQNFNFQSLKKILVILLPIMWLQD